MRWLAVIPLLAVALGAPRALAGEFWVPSVYQQSKILRFDAATGAQLGSITASPESVYDIERGPDGYAFTTGMGVGYGFMDRYRTSGSLVGRVAPTSLYIPQYGCTSDHRSRMAWGADGSLFASSYAWDPTS